MDLKIGDVLKCIKNVDFNTLCGGNSKPNILFHRNGEKYTIMDINIMGHNKDGTARTNVSIEFKFLDSRVKGYSVGFTYEDIDNRHLFKYFIPIKQHRKNIIDEFRNR